MRSISFRRRATLVALPLLALTPILTGCATTTAIGGRTDSVACSAFEPIRWSARDTDTTIRSVKEHNAAWEAVCKPRKR